MIDVFTPKRIFPECPFKNNQRHAGRCTLQSLTQQCDAYRGDWLHGVMHTEKFFEKFLTLDSAV